MTPINVQIDLPIIALIVAVAGATLVLVYQWGKADGRADAHRRGPDGRFMK